MTFIAWLSLVGVCAVGAMSPGPSLAVILQQRLQRTTGQALIASWSHAAGIFFWGLAASTTLGTLFQRFPAGKTGLTGAGAAFLVYLAIQSWRSGNSHSEEPHRRLPAAWISGLSISLLNPKIFVFFTALFSQFIPAQASPATMLGMALVAFFVDGTWYSLVSLLVGRLGLDKKLNRHGRALNRAAATLYFIVAGLTLGQIAGLMN